MKKNFSLFLCLIPMFALGFWSLVNTHGEVSEWEKRALKKAPDFSWESLFSGQYTKELEEYYADTFPAREVFMDMSAFMGEFYYFDVGAETVLLIGHNGIDPDEESWEAAPGADLQPAHSTREDAMISNNISAIASDTADETLPDVSDTPDTSEVSEALEWYGTSEVSEAPESTAPESEEPPPVELTPPDESDVINAGNIIIIDTRAMEIPYGVQKNMKRYAAVINRTAEGLEDAQVYSMVVPNAGEFYTPASLHTGPTSQQNMIGDMYNMLSTDVISIDAYDKLSRHLDEYLYFRTDHHWTQLGAYYAYTAYCQSAGFTAPPLETYESGYFEDFVGSMYGYTKNYPQSKALKDNPDTLIYYLPQVECWEKRYENARLDGEGYSVSVVATSVSGSYSDKYICYIGGDGALSHIETDVDNERSVVVIKDSFGNAFVPFLTSNYQDIYVIDPRYVNGKNKPSLNLIQFVKEQKIDDVLFINYPFPMNANGWCDMLERLTAG